MARNDDNQMFLNCSRCGLSIRVRFISVQMEHCPRCLARARILQPLFSSPMPMRMLRAAASADCQPPDVGVTKDLR